jgi:hypothetical protein
MSEQNAESVGRKYPDTRKSLELTRRIIETTMAYATTDVAQRYWQEQLDDLDRRIAQTDGEVSS